MESKTDLQHFLTDLQALWLILKRRWRPAGTVFLAILSLAVLATLLRKPTYEAKGKLLLEKSNVAASLTEAGRQIGDLQSLSYKDPMDNEVEKLRSAPLVQKMIDTLQLKNDEGERLEPEAITKKKLKLEKIRGTDILLIAYQSDHPSEAAAVVNKLMLLYQESNLQVDRGKAAAAREFIQQQLPITESVVRQAETALRQFKEGNRVADLNQEASLAVKSVAELQEQAAATRIQLQQVEAKSQMLGKLVQMTPEAALDLSVLSQTPGVQEVLGKLQAVQEKLAIAQTNYQDVHPVIAKLRSEEASLQQLLRTRMEQALGSNQSVTTERSPQIRGLKQELFEDFVKLQVDKVGLENHLAGLEHEYSTYRQRLQVLPRLEQEQRQLESKLAAARGTYELLLKKLEEIRIAENQNIGNSQIIEYAEVPEDIELRPIALRLALGIFVGGMGAIATIVILEIRDRTLKTVKEVREFLGYTLLGVIPTLSKYEQNSTATEEDGEILPRLIVRDAPRSPISEAYRMLQSNLKFLSSDQALRTLVVTSCIVGEGKSTVSANLALAIAQRGQKVLLVDADLRRPIQHHLWDRTSVPGLSDLIIGQTNVATAIQVVMDDLHVLTAGVIPPNPGALLDSKRMASLFNSFAENYDYVIFDCPSLSVADDPRILGQLADGILLVVRPGLVDLHTANSSKEYLSQLEHNILGMVVNGVVPEYEPHNYDYYIREYGTETQETSSVDHPPFVSR